MAGPSDLSERVCKHKVQSKKSYLEILSFSTNILPSLITVKEPEGVAQTCSVKNLFLEIKLFTGKHLCQSLFLNKVTGCWLLLKNL